MGRSAIPQEFREQSQGQGTMQQRFQAGWIHTLGGINLAPVRQLQDPQNLAIDDAGGSLVLGEHHLIGEAAQEGFRILLRTGQRGGGRGNGNWRRNSQARDESDLVSNK